MSEPIRYTQNIKCVEPSYHAQNIQSGMVECSIGEWVLHSDYARLKAEVERLTNENGNNSFMKEEWYLKCMSARAENERLRKAGEPLAKRCEQSAFYPSDYELVKAWNAAKEGKPSV